MLPDYIIYDELKREREKRERRREERPQLEIPRYMPLWPEDDEPRGDEKEEDPSSGEVIIQMI